MSDRCWILAGGPEDELPCIAVPQDAFVLCADSGLRLAERLKITPALVLGDFDSLGALPEIPYWQAPVEKDDTDTMLAVRYGLAKGYRDFVICGAFGGRLDHTYANIQTLCFLHSMGAEGLLVGARDLVNLQPAGKTVRYAKQEQCSLSVFALSAECSGITLKGVKYPLEQATLRWTLPLGVSNEILAQEAEISCESGMLLIIRSKL